MMAITTKSSISVKPALREDETTAHLLCHKDKRQKNGMIFVWESQRRF